MTILIRTALFLLGICYIFSCSNRSSEPRIQTVTGTTVPGQDEIWLSHEHILVDFIGAESIDPSGWNHQSVERIMLPYLEELKKHQVSYFVDATPNYLGRDAELLKKMSESSGLKILTNTGLYGAVNNKYLPSYVQEKSAEELAEMWIREFEEGIDGTGIRPGFIKISVESKDPLPPLHKKIVKAAAITHRETGLTIASHTGKAAGLWPQLQILDQIGVSPDSFVWVHAQNEDDFDNYIKAAEAGCWISLDGLGWDIERHVERLVFAKENGILHRILISHDAGWYDPQKGEQTIQPYTSIFDKLYPELIRRGFQEDEFHQLISENPAKAFAISKDIK